MMRAVWNVDGIKSQAKGEYIWDHYYRAWPYCISLHCTENWTWYHCV